MTGNSNNPWDREASRALQAKPQKWLSYYLGNSYRRATKIVLRYKVGKHINLLKTDLWNEGIRTEREVLNSYQNNKRFNLYGMDVSRLTCNLAHGKNKKINIIQGSIRNLPFRAGFFDAVLDLSTLDHVPENEVSGIIQEYKQVLKKDGILVLIFWYSSRLQRLVSKSGKTIHRSQPIGMTQYYFPVSSVKNEVKRDFDILEEFYLGALLNIHNRVTDPIFKSLPKSVYNLILNIEYSKTSTRLLKGLAGLYALIARKR